MLQKEDASVKVDDDNQSEKDSGMDDEPLAEISSGISINHSELLIIWQHIFHTHSKNI